MGMYVGGEIADLARMAQPRIGVVTAVQPVHLARIGSLEAIEAAKGELLEALPPDGRAILNADDPIVRRMGLALGGAQPQLRLRGRRRRRRRGRRVGRSRRHALHAARRGRAPSGEHPDARPAVGPQRAGRRPRSAAPPACRSTRSRPASRPAGRRRTGSSSSDSAGSPSSTTRTTPRRGRSSPRSTCWPGCPAGGARCSARCSSWARPPTTATGPSARPPPGRSTGSSWSATARRASPRAPRPPGLAPARIVRVRDVEVGPRGDPAAAARRRRRPRQGVARDRPRPARRRPPGRVRSARPVR